MDGSIPIIYISLVIGSFISFCLLIAQSWLKFSRPDDKKKALTFSKSNLILTSSLTLVFLYFKSSIIGYGALTFILPIELLLVLLLYIKPRYKYGC